MAAPFPAGPPGRPGRSTTTIAVIVALSLIAGFVVLALAGWGAYALLRDDSPAQSQTPPEPSSTAPVPSVPADLSAFYEQKLDWSDCEGDECAQLEVPLDYAEPQGRTIELAVLRVRAERRNERVGQLVVNPGGPGGSGVSYASGGASVFGEQLARYYDIVGFDPRGVGKSTAVSCGGTQATDQILSIDPDPDTAAETRQLDEVTRSFGEGCLRDDAGLTRHVSTVEAAKDMDILRAALGERQLDYLGASYGTLLGATYADLFPTHVRRMVLDGAIDPAQSTKGIALGQAGGFDTALRAYLEDCVGQGGCPLGSTTDEAYAAITDFVRQVDADPLPTSGERELTEGLAVYGIFLPLYVKSYWPLLTAALTQAIDQGNGTQLLALADQYSSRDPDGYRDNSTSAILAINCLDHGDPLTLDQVPAQEAEFEKVSPAFGRVFAYGTTSCASWPVQSGSVTKAMKAAGAPPIVVVGTTRDPATPYRWSQALADQLESGRLISRDGDGHTGFNQGNACVDKAVEGYLLKGKAPADGLDC